MKSRYAAKTYKVIIDIREETKKEKLPNPISLETFYAHVFHRPLSHTSFNKHGLKAGYYPVSVLGAQGTEIENSAPALKGL